MTDEHEHDVDCDCEGCDERNHPEEVWPGPSDLEIRATCEVLDCDRARWREGRPTTTPSSPQPLAK